MSKARRFGAGRIVLWACVALMLAAVVVLGRMAKRRAERKEAESPAESAERIFDVRVLRVEPRTVADRVSVVGRLEPYRDVYVAAEKPGRIVDLPVPEGGAVSAGDVVFRLDDEAWQALHRQAEIERDEARRVWKRFDSLRGSGGISDHDYDAVVRRLDLASNALVQADIHVSRCTGRSPVSGVVETHLMDVGEYPAEGNPLVRVLEVSRLKLVADIPERDVRGVAVGQQVSFSVGAVGGTFTGVVEFVSAAATLPANTYRTELAVDNAAGDLRAGMIASLDLVRGALPDAVVLPLNAVVPERGEHVVYIVEDDRAVRRRVFIDAVRGRDAILGGGVTAGDRVVIEGQRRLDDGQPVKVVE